MSVRVGQQYLGLFIEPTAIDQACHFINSRKSFKAFCSVLHAALYLDQLLIQLVTLNRAKHAPINGAPLFAKYDVDNHRKFIARAMPQLKQSLFTTTLLLEHWQHITFKED